MELKLAAASERTAQGSPAEIARKERRGKGEVMAPILLASSKSGGSPGSPGGRMRQRLHKLRYRAWAGKKAGRSGGGVERPVWRSPPGRRVKLCPYIDGLF